MRRKMMTCFMIIFIPCFVSGCSNKTIKKWSDQVKDDIVKDAESQGITIDIPSNDEKEKTIIDGDETTGNIAEKNRYSVGEPVSMIANNSAEVNVTITEWGNYYDTYTQESLLYVSYIVENTGTQDFVSSDSMFTVYADNYNINFAYPLDADDSDGLGTTLSPGRKLKSVFYAKINPNTVSNLELEYGDVIFVLKEQNEEDTDTTEKPEVMEQTAWGLQDVSGKYVSGTQTVSISIYTEISDDGSIGTLEWSNNATEEAEITVLYEYSAYSVVCNLKGIDYRIVFSENEANWYDEDNTLVNVFEKTESYQS